jgi:membrane-associated progesterone receptor component
MAPSVFELSLAAVAAAAGFVYYRYSGSEDVEESSRPDTAGEKTETEDTVPFAMNSAAPSSGLPPAKNDPFTLEQLKPYNGSDVSKPIYVSIKGKPITVSRYYYSSWRYGVRNCL